MNIKEDESVNALQLGLYDIIFLRYGNHNYGSTNFISSGYGINYSRLLMSIVHAFGADKDKTSLVNRLDLEQHWGTWSYDGNDYSTGLTANATPPALIISEVSDPSDVYQARFIELYNAGEATIDFDTETWYLCRQTNGTITWENKQLTGSINSGETYVIANNNDNTADYFYQNYNFMADFHYGGSAGNGDDGYFLYIFDK